MKKLFFLLLLLPAFASAQESSAYYREGDQVFVHAPNGLNMRTKAEASAAKIATLPYGTKVKVLSKDYSQLEIKDFGGFPIHDIWYKVDYQGKKGYVFGGYISRFPPVGEKLKTPTIGSYIKESLKLKQTLVLENWAFEGSEPNPCHTISLYEEGVVVTQDFCSEKCNTVRYLFEDTQASEVASILLACLSQGKEKYEVKFDEKAYGIIVIMELCEMTIREISTGGVILDVFCCC